MSKLPRELLELVYKFCNIDTRLKLNKIGIYKRIKLKKYLYSSTKIVIPNTAILSNTLIDYIDNEKYRLMYTKIHKRGPWFIELWITQLLSKYCDVEKAWQLDIDSNKWIPRNQLH